MPSVNSRNIASAEYDPADETRGTPAKMTVQFRNGSIYEYVGVPKDVYGGLLEAGSPGSYLNAQVKGRYGFNKLA